MSLQWELEYEVSWRPRQVVYISMETDISALTYPNKRLYVILLAPEEEITEEERMTIEEKRESVRG